MKAVLIRPDNEIVTQDVDFDAIAKDMHGYIQSIPNHTTHDIAILADEDGTMKGLATNLVASLFSGFPLVGAVWIVGNGVTEDFDDVTQDVIDELRLLAAQC